MKIKQFINSIPQQRDISLNNYRELYERSNANFVNIKETPIYKSKTKKNIDILEQYLEGQKTIEAKNQAINYLEQIKCNKEIKLELASMKTVCTAKNNIDELNINEQKIKDAIINLIRNDAKNLLTTIKQNDSIIEREKGNHKFNAQKPIFSSLKASAEMQLKIENSNNILNGHNGHIIPNNKLEDALKGYFRSKDVELVALCTYLKSISKYIPLKRFVALIEEEPHDLAGTAEDAINLIAHSRLSIAEAIDLIAESIIWNPANLTQAPEDKDRMPDYSQKKPDFYPKDKVDTRALAKLENKILKNELINLTKLLDIKPELIANEQEKLSLVENIINTPTAVLEEVYKNGNNLNFITMHGSIIKDKNDINVACKKLGQKDLITILDAVDNISKGKEDQAATKYFKKVLNDINIKPLVDYNTFFGYMSSIIDSTNGDYADIKWRCYEIEDINHTVIDIQDVYDFV